MNEEKRPSPEELLEAIRREDKERTKGKLKIFLGMAAGVGKTFAMLEEAQQLNREGENIVIGTINTHGREETARLLEGLTIIPEKTIIYREIELKELDYEKIIAVHPNIVLVDELAHSNVPGVTHSKRWQDVLEILEHGIDVYTTLNVQHIESLNDVVERITGISVKETVPDLMIEVATSIQLIDLTPDELLERLKEGKVYLGDQSQYAQEHFFQKDRLTALREIVLRYTAEKVDFDLHNLISSVGLATEWKPREKILVAISTSPLSQKLIRAARRYAFNLNATWIAVFVDDGKVLYEEDSAQLAKNMTLARDLGAEVVTTNDPDIANGIQRIARQREITQIIVGRHTSRSLLDYVTGRATLLEKLVKECKDVDIYVIRQERYSLKHRKKLFAPPPKKQIVQYILALAFVMLLFAINWLAFPFVGYRNSGLIFLLGILSLSLFLKKGPILFTSCLFVVLWALFFIPPEENSMVFEEDIALLIIFLLTAISTGILVDRARERKEMLAKREESAQALYDIVRLIASAPSTAQIFKSIKRYLEKLFSGSFEMIIKLIDDGLVLDSTPSLVSEIKEKSTAIWAFENGKEAGWSTSTLPSSKNLYIPLKGFHEVVGVLVYQPKTQKTLTIEEKNFIYTVCQQLSHYIERVFSEERNRKIAQLSQEEQVYEGVLHKISSELELPLKTMKEKDKSSIPIVERQIHKIESSSEGLLRILETTSAMVKLDGKFIPSQKKLHKIHSLIDSCIHKMAKKLQNRKVEIIIDERLPAIHFDFSLMKTLLNNLILNAIEYSPPGSPITIDVHEQESQLVLSVIDESPKIPEDKLDMAFDNYVRIPGFTPSDMGVGLTIAKKIAHSHNGTLKAEQHPKGMKFSLYMPLENVKG